MAKARTVVWSDRALADLEAAYAYFLERSAAYAATLLDAVEKAADMLESFPDRGRVVPELGIPKIREIIVEQHRLVYEIGATEISILRILHGRRDFKSTWKSNP